VVPHFKSAVRQWFSTFFLLRIPNRVVAMWAKEIQVSDSCVQQLNELNLMWATTVFKSSCELIDENMKDLLAGDGFTENLCCKACYLSVTVKFEPSCNFRYIHVCIDVTCMLCLFCNLSEH